MLHYGVIGCPIAHSLSPEIYGQLFEKYGVSADFSRILIEPGDIGMLREITGGLSGFAVTMPYKRAVMQYLDGITDTAAECGAVNIVERRDGLLIGHNTDGMGLVDALDEAGAMPEPCRVFILGRGGAAISAACAIRRRGGEPVLLVRTPGAPAGFDRLLFDKEDLAGKSCGVFINASPLGMGGAEGFASFDFLDELSPRAVLDMVYLRGGETPLISEARSRGMIAVDGSRMLLMQALRAFRIWTGIEAHPEDVTI